MTAATVHVYFADDTTATDVSDTTRAVRIRRGRSRQLDTIEAGSAEVVLGNTSRVYDPLYSAGAYFGNIVPSKRVEVLVGTVPLFDGRVDDWSIAYDVSGDSVAVLVASDALAKVARASLPAKTWTAQKSGVRVDAVLDVAEVSYADARDTDTGVADLQADSVTEGTNALQYLQLVATTEQGRLFAAADGTLTFRNRQAALNKPAGATFADDGTGIGFTAAEIEVGSDLLYNRTVVTRSGGTAQIADDATSQTAYGVRALSVETLHANNTDAKDLATHLLGLYGDPEVRVAAVTIAVHSLDSTDRDLVLGLELGDVVGVVWTPLGIGDQIDRTHIIEGIEHEIYPAQHTLTLRLGDADRRAFLVLDDAVFGVLDANLLAY